VLVVVVVVVVAGKLGRTGVYEPLELEPAAGDVVVAVPCGSRMSV
jgi:hypothetical protein